MLLFKRGIRKVVFGIVIPGINTKYIPQFISKDDNFRKIAANNSERARRHSINWPVTPHIYSRLLSFVELVYYSGREAPSLGFGLLHRLCVEPVCACALRATARSS